MPGHRAHAPGVFTRIHKAVTSRMGPRAQAIRQRIIDAADNLFYQKGYEHTSFTDIADAVQISRGNFYYHFKSKDEILCAVIQARIATHRSRLAEWDAQYPEPRARILRYLDALITNQAKIREHGCPIGTLCSELSKLQHTSQPEAGALFGLYREWLARQFTLLGHAQEADHLAMHLIARVQGIAMLTNTFHDAQFIEYEVAKLRDWVDTLTPASHSATQA